jgi:hypothetical protein
VGLSLIFNRASFLELWFRVQQMGSQSVDKEAHRNGVDAVKMKAILITKIKGTS